jgi:hypothetical protein
VWAGWDRPYKERQHIPGDNDAQVSIHGGIARHGLEHLAFTDRGVTMFRNIIRREIRAVQHGADPTCPAYQGGKVITTYSQDKVVQEIPPAPTPAEDGRLLRDIGRKLVEDCQQVAHRPRL